MFGRSKSDVELLRASLDGSTQAFGVVVGRYQSLVCAITYGATGDVGRSEELAQEAFLRAWKSLGQLQDLGKFRAWLCSIARSTVQNWFRSEKRDVVGRAAPLDVAAERASHESGPEEAVMVKEQQAVVRQTLARMPEGLREPLILFYREGRSTREVAELLGLSENAARQRISRGRGMLREQMAEMVETAIARTKPGKAFTAAVIASIAGLGVKGTATAVAAAGGSHGIASILSGLTAKVAVVAVGAVVIAGGIVVYRQVYSVKEPLARAGIQSIAQEQAEQVASPVLPISQARVATDAAAGAEGLSETSPAVATPGAEAGAPSAPVARDRHAAATEEEAKQFEFTPKGVLSGRITDIETGEPVRDARLAITMGRVYTARTDANGFYSLEKIEKAGDFRVSVVSREYIGIPDDDRNSNVHLSPDKQIVKHLQLPKACMVDVWVVDGNGVGIKDARVVGTLLADDRKREVNRSVYSTPGTDPNGYVLLGGFPPAETDYLITAWHTVETGVEQRNGRRFTRSECDYAPGRAAVRLTDPNVVRQIHIVLDPGQTVYARTEYEDGLPAADTDIELKPTWWHCNYVLPRYRTDSDGVLVARHITPGLYDVFVSMPMGDSRSISRKVMQAQLPPAGAEPLVVRLAGKSPQSLVSITGSLICRGPKRPSSIEIESSSRTGQPIYGTVDYRSSGETLGTFTVDRLEPGTYTLRFSGDGIEDVTMPNVVAPSTGLQVELVYAAKPNVAGSVVDAATGAAIRDFGIRVRKLRTLRGAPYVQTNRWVHYENERGEFSLDVVGPGIYQVQVTAKGYAPAWSEQINTDASTPEVVALSAGGSISGRVVNERGEPVGGAKIVPLSLANGAMSDTEDVFVSEDGAVEAVDGRFTLDHVSAGAETLKVTHPDYAVRIVPEVLVAEGRTTGGIEVVLTTGGTVEGYVYDLQGKPQAGQVLFAQEAGGPDSTMYAGAGRFGKAVADANGFYRFEHLPERLCHIQRMEEARALGVLCRAVLPRNGQVTRLDLGGLPVVRGRVVLDGVPAAKTRLQIGPARSQHTGAFRCYAFTDEQGNFTFGGAPSGSYSIQCERSTEQSRWVPIGMITVGSADTDAGTLPANGSSLLVTLPGGGMAGDWSIESVSLSTGKRLWSASAGIASSPSKPGDPYIIRSVEPGQYTLNVRRADQVYWQQPVQLDPAKRPWTLSLDLPVSKASVSGRIRGIGARTLVLCREQRDVIAVVQLGPAGVCRVEHLPAGRYWVGDFASALHDLPPLAEFDLREGEDKILDLDLSATQEVQTGFVRVQVVDEAALAIDNAQIRLEGPQGPVLPVYSEETGQGFLTVAGPHTLHVQAAGRRPVVRKLNVRLFDRNLAMPQTVLVCLERQ